MSDLDRKTRTISLRISEQDYESLKSVYAAQGVRSLSEFARSAMHHIAGQSRRENGFGGDLELKLLGLYGKVSRLEEEVSRLTRLIDREPVGTEKD